MFVCKGSRWTHRISRLCVGVTKGERIMLKEYATLGLAGTLLIAATGCENLPGDEAAQGATIGGVSGAAVGAAVGGEGNRLLGALIGGVVGAGGGYLIGANWDKITGKDSEGAS